MQHLQSCCLSRSHNCLSCEVNNNSVVRTLHFYLNLHPHAPYSAYFSPVRSARNCATYFIYYLIARVKELWSDLWPLPTLACHAHQLDRVRCCMDVLWIINWIINKVWGYGLLLIHIPQTSFQYFLVYCVCVTAWLANFATKTKSTMFFPFSKPSKIASFEIKSPIERNKCTQ